MTIQLYKGDCLEVMDNLIQQGIKVDAVITDPPYGTTACKWDSVIPFEEMWKRLKLLRKDNAPIVLFGSEPFSSYLRLSNIKEYKYDWIYKKRVASNFAQAKYQPLKEHENVIIFYKHNYYPIKEPRKGHGLQRLKAGYKSNPQAGDFIGNIKTNRVEQNYDELKYPSSVQEFNNRDKERGLHPTQKPVALMEYLIKTYTKEGDVVLDFCMGSGTTGVACKNLNRKFIGIELDDKYFEIAKNRIDGGEK